MMKRLCVLLLALLMCGVALAQEPVVTPEPDVIVVDDQTTIGFGGATAEVTYFPFKAETDRLALGASLAWVEWDGYLFENVKPIHVNPRVSLGMFDWSAEKYLALDLSQEISGPLKKVLTEGLCLLLPEKMEFIGEAIGNAASLRVGVFVAGDITDLVARGSFDGVFSDVEFGVAIYGGFEFVHRW